VSGKKLDANIKRSTVALMIILVLSVCLLSAQQANGQADQASSKLQVANDAVNQAFNAVLDAEKAGANVTGLLAQLNNAQGILAQAENSYRTGDFNTAANQADSVLPIVQQVTLDAQSVKQTAIVSSQNAFWTTIALTVIGIFVFVLILFLVWRRFKRNYIERLSESKPELVNNE
jgi:preprotein translocase subunit SecF